jgi:hypothetical protein
MCVTVLQVKTKLKLTGIADIYFSAVSIVAPSGEYRAMCILSSF